MRGGCDAVRGNGSCLYKYWLREATGIAPPEANCLRRDEAYPRGSSSLFVGDGRMERTRLAEPESGGVGRKMGSRQVPCQ